MKILVIEDSELHRMSAAQSLANHEVTIVKSYDEAMELMDEKIDKAKRDRLLVEAGFKSQPESSKDEKWRAYWDARKKASSESAIPFDFEVVLTDMMLPMSEDTLAPGVWRRDEQVPYGFVIALRATTRGAKYVAMLTDTNHHQSAMSASLDKLGGTSYYKAGFRPNFEINGAKAMFVHSPFRRVDNTTCDKCHGEKGSKGCYKCDASGKAAGKDWGQVLKDLTQD